MRLPIALILALSIVLGCTSKPPAHRTRTAQIKAASHARQVFPPKSRRRPEPKTRKTLPLPPLNRPSIKLLPSIVHPADRSVMVLIDSGKYRIGFPAARVIQLRAFYIDQREITVRQYKRFDKRYDEKAFTGDKECNNCPVMGINWVGASGYCLWARKRLPSEAEWEAAARGQTDYPWPWGMEFQASKANLLGASDGALFAAPVGSYPPGTSPLGVMDMTGNVWEWVRTPLTLPAAEGKIKTFRIVKGGGWTSQEQTSSISFRNIVDPKTKNPTFGFRCAKSLTGGTPSEKQLKRSGAHLRKGAPPLKSAGPDK